MKKKINRDSERFYELLGWENLISITDAMKIYGKSRVTIIERINSGILIEGVDCKKMGKTWVMDIRSLDLVFDRIK